MNLSPGQIVSGRHGWTYEVSNPEPDEDGYLWLTCIKTGTRMRHRVEEIRVIEGRGE